MASSPNIERLYDDHAPALFAFLLNLLRNEADTYDVLQDVFIKLGRRPALLPGVRDERGFLLRLAHNAAIDLIRRRDARERHYSQFAREPTPLFAQSADPDERIFREKLAEALGELPPDQRAVVHLKLWEKLTFEAIAETLEIPLNTAASRYRYGLDKLRDRLRPLFDEIK
jgi:RNA polymerase sigma-70 factor (ECF subfamily)